METEQSVTRNSAIVLSGSIILTVFGCLIFFKPEITQNIVNPYLGLAMMSAVPPLGGLTASFIIHKAKKIGIFGENEKPQKPYPNQANLYSAIGSFSFVMAAGLLHKNQIFLGVPITAGSICLFYKALQSALRNGKRSSPKVASELDLHNNGNRPQIP